MREPEDDDDEIDILSLFGDPDPGPPPSKPDPTFANPLSGPVIFTTLEEAIRYIEAHMEEGIECPCCKQNVKLYKRALNHAMARSLIWLVREAGTDLDWVDVPKTAPKWMLKSREYAKLLHWGLIEEQVKDPHDTMRRTSGIWRPTTKGVKFAQRQLQVPRRVHLYNNTILGWDDEQVGIVECLGKKFDYQRLMLGLD